MYLVVPPGGCFEETRRIELGPGALTIGRAESCEIRIDVPGVDQEHAKISAIALVALGPDCAVGDVPLDLGARRLLTAGDEVQVGSVVLVVERDDLSLAYVLPLEGAHANRRMDSVSAIEDPCVRVVEGANFGSELVLEEEGRAYLIGRDAACDFVLDDREVSREHVKVMRKGYAVYVQDLTSTRGSWLGRSAVYNGSTVEWSHPRMLRLGATVLSLALPEVIRRAAAPVVHASAPMTPPPRSRKNMGEPARSAPAAGVSAALLSMTTPRTPEVSGRGLEALSYGVTPPPPPSAPGGGLVAAFASHVLSSAGPPSAPAMATAVASEPRGLGALPKPSHARRAWKTSGPVVGKASGLLLLALAGLVVLGGLFVVFSLLE